MFNDAGHVQSYEVHGMNAMGRYLVCVGCMVLLGLFHSTYVRVVVAMVWFDLFRVV